VAPLLPEVMPTSQLPRATLLAWRSTATPEIIAMWERRIDTALTDLAIAREILAAEMAGRHDRVVAYVTARLESRKPAVLARTLIATGFCSEDPVLGAVFEHDRFRHGFLAEVAEAARRSYDQAKWARHWFRASRDGDCEVDVWRFGELAAAAVDARCVLWMEEGRGGRLFETLRGITRDVFSAAARQHDRVRRDRLFGISAPPDYLTIR
jgi:hypothetical protein